MSILGNERKQQQKPNVAPPKKSIQQTNITILAITALLICTICIGITFLGSGGGGGGDESTPTVAVEDLHINADVQCEEYVTARLKAPSTAKFHYSRDNIIYLGNGIYEVRSYVDAQNSFGAMLRNDYYCKVQYKSGDVFDDRSWNLIQLDLVQR